MNKMFAIPARLVLGAIVALTLALSASAEVRPFPPGFHTEKIKTHGATIYVRVGGHGPAVVFLHGFGDTGDMWAAAAKALEHAHRRRSRFARHGFVGASRYGLHEKDQAADIAGVLDALKIQTADLVTHDIGNMVGYALAVQYSSRITKWVVIDAPLPGIGNWEEIKQSPLLWHFNFRGPDEERLVAGRERIYLDRFYNELSDDPKKIDEATRQHYAALYARPHAMHDAFEQFGAFNQDAIDNKALLAEKGKLMMPVLALGGDKSFGTAQADVLRNVANNVTGGIIAHSGHWIMEERPDATVKAVRDFLEKK